MTYFGSPQHFDLVAQTYVAMLLSHMVTEISMFPDCVSFDDLDGSTTEFDFDLRVVLRNGAVRYVRVVSNVELMRNRWDIAVGLLRDNLDSEEEDFIVVSEDTLAGMTFDPDFLRHRCDELATENLDIDFDLDGIRDLFNHKVTEFTSLQVLQAAGVVEREWVDEPDHDDEEDLSAFWPMAA